MGLDMTRLPGQATTLAKDDAGAQMVIGAIRRAAIGCYIDAMCGRFTNQYSWRELVELYRLAEPYITPCRTSSRALILLRCSAAS